jgi:hypothetical protein
MLEVLDFHYGISDKMQMDWQSREKLGQIVLEQLSAEPQLLIGLDVN